MLEKFKRSFRYFTRNEIILWLVSVAIIIASFLIFDRVNYITLVASLIGVTALIFNAKANPIGQMLMIVFCILYGIISHSFRYYGEMITYVFMSGPMCVFALVAWLKNPYNGNRSEVEIYSLKKKDVIMMTALSLVTTFIFYFILKAFHTANLIPSTISVTTTFLGVYLTYKRSPFFALGYAANDVVLIVLWVLASLEDLSYVSVVICFIIFFINDIYGYISWSKIHKKQKNNLSN